MIRRVPLEVYCSTYLTQLTQFRVELGVTTLIHDGIQEQMVCSRHSDLKRGTLQTHKCLKTLVASSLDKLDAYTEVLVNGECIIPSFGQDPYARKPDRKVQSNVWD